MIILEAPITVAPFEMGTHATTRMVREFSKPPFLLLSRICMDCKRRTSNFLIRVIIKLREKTTRLVLKEWRTSDLRKTKLLLKIENMVLEERHHQHVFLGENASSRIFRVEINTKIFRIKVE